MKALEKFGLCIFVVGLAGFIIHQTTFMYYNLSDAMFTFFSIMFVIIPVIGAWTFILVGEK